MDSESSIKFTVGTPDPSIDDAGRSIRAGVAINAALEELNRERKRPASAGIGSHDAD